MDTSFQYEPLLKRFDMSVIEPLYEVNKHCIELLVNAARRVNGSQAAIDNLPYQLRDSFIGMDSAARGRCAQCPSLLVDLEFRNGEFWEKTARTPGRTPRPLPYFSRQSSVKLARETVVLAWHIIRSNRDAATVFLGLSPPVINVISNLRLSEIDLIAERQFHHVVPRWKDRLLVWKTLLQCARVCDEKSTHNLNLISLQLSVGELIYNLKQQA